MSPLRAESCRLVGVAGALRSGAIGRIILIGILIRIIRGVDMRIIDLQGEGVCRERKRMQTDLGRTMPEGRRS
jgi:hypothetical protein